MSAATQSIIIFVGSFLVSFMSVAYVFISPIERAYLKEWLTSSEDPTAKARAAAEARKKAEAEKKARDIAKQVRKEKKAEKKGKKAAGDEEDEDGPEVPPAPEDDEDAAEAEAQAQAELDEDPEKTEGDEVVKAPQETVRDTRVQMMTFLEGALAGLMKDGMRLDGVNRFGCHLFLAGAAEGLTRAAGLSHGQFQKILEKCVAVLGTDKKMARQFGKKYEEYLLEPKYCDMFRSGSSAMERFIEDDSMNVASALSQALDEWNTSADQADSGKPIAVMFTDIVGSTKLTQDHGDDAMQKIVRVHNKIIRGELRNFAGTEVKHTGDGIMASFKAVGNSVEASLAMMKDIDKFNKSAGDIPLQIRIGVNAGTPIAEDGDLFGTTVQIAARLCDKAEDGGIAVSNLVRELSSGRAADYEEMGEMDLKGVSEPITVFSVVDKS